MVKTQVQFPDHLFKEAKRIAFENEMSFAEVVRRGVEQVVKDYPPGRISGSEWTLSAPAELGSPLVPESEWDMAARDEV